MIVLKVLLFVLRILGITFLVLLGILILALLLLLFVPVRYRGRINREGEALTVRGRIRFLWPLLGISVDYADNKLKYKVRVLFFTLAADDKKKRERPPKEGKKQKDEAGPEKVCTEEKSEKEGPENAGVVPKTGECEKSAAEIEESPEALEAQTEDFEDGKEKELSERNLLQKLSGKLKRFIEKIRTAIKNFTDRIVGLFASIKDKITKIFHTKDKILAFLQEEETKKALSLTGKSILQLLKHVLPYKIKGEAVFGTGEPYSMGQALSVLGIFYGVYARTLKVTPDFETESFRLDLNLEGKGRIRLIQVLVIVLRCYFKGKLKNVIRKAKHLVAES